ARDSRRDAGATYGWILFAGLEAVSHPRLGDDVARGGGVGFQLLAQLSHEDAEIFDLLRTLSSPDGAQESAVVHDLARTPCQEDEQVKFFRSEAHFAVTDRHFMRRGVDAEVADLDH